MTMTDWIFDHPKALILREMLQAAVPLEVVSLYDTWGIDAWKLLEEYQADARETEVMKGKEGDERIINMNPLTSEEAAILIAGHCNDYQAGKAAKTFTRLARMVAIASFYPCGIKCLGLHFQAEAILKAWGITSEEVRSEGAVPGGEL